jgi:hypothetical protein
MTRKSSYANDDPRSLMAKAIMRPLIDDSINHEWVDGSTMSSFASTFIKPSEQMTSLQRLEVYNQQYWYRLLDSLRDDFPGLLSVLGDERFTELLVAYLTKYPSRHFNLRNLGDRLETFVKEDNDLFKKQDKKLILDVISFEWSEIQAFDAEKRPDLDLEKYSSLARTDPKLELQPYVFILSLDYAVDEFLLQRRKFADSRTVVTARRVGHQSKSAHLSKPKKQKTYVVIHRQNNSVYYKRINIVEYKVLAAIKAGASITEACAAVRAKDLEWAYGSSETVGSLGESFSDWTRLGWFCAIKT